MSVRWTPRALEDLQRIYAFMAPIDPSRAAGMVRALVGRTERLTQLPRIGQRLPEYAPREVRRLFIGDYELRYELEPSTILVLRLWHTKEDR